MAKSSTTPHVVCRNKQATFKFELLERLECGLILQGTEVKSLRDNGANLEHAYARIDRSELWLIDCHIGPYRYGYAANHDSTRKRKLLLHSREFKKLEPMLKIKGLTLVPVEIRFNERGIAKVVIALARGKTLGDKRQTLKDKEHSREMDHFSKKRRQN